MSPKILILGAGGIGGYFGGRLVESGADVTFLLRDGAPKAAGRAGLKDREPVRSGSVGSSNGLVRIGTKPTKALQAMWSA
jgi:prephenate dehydrogenase